MSKKSKERLRWALRYIICHPDISPSILSEEWKITTDKAIDICSHNFAIAIAEWKITNFKKLEREIFKKISSYK